MEQLLLLTVVAVAALTAVAGFVIGDRRRRGDLGRSGPQPCRSIGDALVRAQLRHARVLLLFLGEGQTSLKAREALANDSGLLALLERPDLLHVLVGEDREIAETLFLKYAKAELPKGPAAVLLDRAGLLIGTKAGELPALPAWVEAQPAEGHGEPPGAVSAEQETAED